MRAASSPPHHARPSAWPPAITSIRLFLPQLVAQIKQQAPHCPIEILPLSAESDYRARLAQGEVDVVIGNWLKPPDDLHLGRLFGDEVVCLVARDHPAVRREPGGWDAAGLAGGRAHCPHAHPPGRARRDRRTPGFSWACSATSRRAARISG